MEYAYHCKLYKNDYDKIEEKIFIRKYKLNFLYYNSKFKFWNESGIA
jgi:hypothetical protein